MGGRGGRLGGHGFGVGGRRVERVVFSETREMEREVQADVVVGDGVLDGNETTKLAHSELELGSGLQSLVGFWRRVSVAKRVHKQPPADGSEHQGSRTRTRTRS